MATSKYSDLQIVSGYDPLSCVFTDYSYSRSYPLSVMHIKFGDQATYGGFELSNQAFSDFADYGHVTSDTIVYEESATRPDDCFNENEAVVSHLYKGPGVYFATTIVCAASTNTDSWNLSTSNFDGIGIVEATREIHVLEVCPKVIFDFVKEDSYTVKSDFSHDSSSSIIPAITADAGINPAFEMTNRELISGYAPLLHVAVDGILLARSLPISASQWDFGDWYADQSNNVLSTYAPPDALGEGWPVWRENGYPNIGSHDYTMPGLYNITLVPYTSSPNGYISQCFGETRELCVYVQEIPPSDFDISILSGDTNVSPVSVLVSATGLSAGSFPICRIDIDFGDKSEILSVSRLMSSEYLDYIKNNMYEDADPRNVVFEHTYMRTNYHTPDTYTISMSAYACNTTTMVTATKEFGPISTPSFEVVEGDLHLVDNQISTVEDNVLLVFEGTKQLNKYTMLLSSIKE